MLKIALHCFTSWLTVILFKSSTANLQNQYLCSNYNQYLPGSKVASMDWLITQFFSNPFSDFLWRFTGTNIYPHCFKLVLEPCKLALGIFTCISILGEDSFKRTLDLPQFDPATTCNQMESPWDKSPLFSIYLTCPDSLAIFYSSKLLPSTAIIHFSNIQAFTFNWCYTQILLR